MIDFKKILNQLLELKKTIIEQADPVSDKLSQLQQIVKQDLKKDVWGQGQDKVHGWISPEGEYHHMKFNEMHGEVADKLHASYENGWLSVGHAGGLNVAGKKHFLESPNHPAVQTARRLLAQHFPDHNVLISAQHEGKNSPDLSTVSINHWSKHGTIPKPGSIADFRKAKEEELKKEHSPGGKTNMGWISPKGKFHDIGVIQHRVWAKKNIDKDPSKWYGKGWVSVGHGDGHNIAGHEKILNNPDHPATQTARKWTHPIFETVGIERFKDDNSSSGFNDVSVDHWIKHGTIPAKGSVAEFHKAVFPSGQNKVHGWISPKGEYHHIAPTQKHHEYAASHLGFDEPDDAYEKGWLAVGHAGYMNVHGHSKYLNDLSHPATIKARSLVGQHFTGPMTINRDDISVDDAIDVDSHHWSKYGTIPAKGSVAEFHKTESKTKEQDYGYNTHGEWSSVKGLRGVERERGNEFPVPKKMDNTHEGIWVTHKPLHSVAYNFPPAYHEHFLSEKAPKKNPDKYAISSEEHQEALKAFKNPMKYTQKVDVRGAKIMHEDPDGGYLYVRPIKKLKKTTGHLFFPQLGIKQKHYTVGYQRPEYLAGQIKSQYKEPISSANKYVKEHQGFVSYNTLPSYRSPQHSTERAFSGGAVLRPGASKAVIPHEEQHGIFVNIEQDHSRAMRQKVSRHLVDSLPPHLRDSFHKLSWPWTEGVGRGQKAEEKIVSVYGYLNDKDTRDRTHKTLSENGFSHDPAILHHHAKKIWRHFQDKAKDITPDYFGKITKSADVTNKLHLEHYSDNKLSTIDPTKHGTGVKGEEGKFIGDVNYQPRSYHYVAGSKPERLLAGKKYKHTSSVDSNKIYDIDTDTHNFYDKAKATNPYAAGVFHPPTFERHIKDAGYHGYRKGNVVAVFTSLKPHKVEENTPALKKIAFNRPGETQKNAHGWISPQGEYHHMHEDQPHEEYFGWHGKYGIDTPKEAHEKGWLSIGHGGYSNIQGHSKYLNDPSHPATRMARQLARDHFIGDTLTLHYSDKSGYSGLPNKLPGNNPGDTVEVPLEHWAKHGTVPQSIVAEFHKAMPVKTKAPKINTPKVEPVAPKVEEPPLTIKGAPISPNPQIKNNVKSQFDEKTGTLHTPRGSFGIALPQSDTQKKDLFGASSSSEYDKIIKSPDVQRIHEKATNNWLRLHKLMKEGQLPDNLIAHSAIFTILSANNAVPAQELMYSRLVDQMNEQGVDPSKVSFAELMGRGNKLREGWRGSDSPTQLPKHAHEFWAGPGKESITQKSPSELTGRKAGDIYKLQFMDAASDKLIHYPALHGYLRDLVSHHRQNTQEAVSQMMRDKVAGAHPMQLPAGMGPKIGRYFYSMLGGSNAHVPDTHLIRHLFGLDNATDSNSHKYLKQVLWNPQNHELLNGIDRFYGEHYPTVKYVQDKYFKGEKTPDAIFPAFWLHWLSIAPHEKFMGMQSHAKQESAGHEPYWQMADQILKAHGLGEIKKTEEDVPIEFRTASAMYDLTRKIGPTAANLVFYSHIVPHFLKEATKDRVGGFLHRQKYHTNIAKAELKKVIYMGGTPEAHGWISPEGKYHQLKTEGEHDNFINRRYQGGKLDAYQDGWISIGHAGGNNLQGHKYTFDNPNHPALVTARKLAGKHFAEATYVSSVHNDEYTEHVVDTDHWVKHGTIPKKGSVAEFHKSEEGLPQAWIHPNGYIDKKAGDSKNWSMAYHYSPAIYINYNSDKFGNERHKITDTHIAHHLGAISMGHAGHMSISGATEHIFNPQHPANIAARAYIKQFVPADTTHVEITHAPLKDIKIKVENINEIPSIIDETEKDSKNYDSRYKTESIPLEHYIKHGTKPTAMGSLLGKSAKESLLPSKYSIITAESPRFEAKDKGGNKALESELKSKGYKYEPITGKYDESGKVENSFLVHDADSNHMNQLGEKYGQETVLHSESNVHKMHYTNGPKAGQHHKGEGIIIHDKEPKNYYSTVTRGDKKTHFTLNFDFDKLHKTDPILDKLDLLSDLFKSKEGLLQMYKPEHREAAKPFVDWASKTLPNANWQTWAIRGHRDSPKQFTPQVKEQLQHYGGMQHVQAIANLRFGKEHTLEHGLKSFKSAEESHIAEHLKSPDLVPKPQDATKIVDVSPTQAWWSLNKPSCSKEAKAMGHCGNVGSSQRGDNVLSLRTEHKLGDKVYHEPHLTFIENKGKLGQMKGRGNEKPAERYHPAIKKLLLHTGHTPIGGAYLSENNFKLTDLKGEDQKEIINKHPKLTLWSTHVTPEHITQALKDEDPDVRRHAIQHPKVTPEHITQALKDEDYGVRCRALQHPNATQEHITQALKDKDWSVRYRATQHPNATPENITQALKDKDPMVRYLAIGHPNATPENISQALKDKDSGVRYLAIGHPNATPENISQALKDKDSGVRVQAKEASKRFKKTDLILDKLALLKGAMQRLAPFKPQRESDRPSESQEENIANWQGMEEGIEDYRSPRVFREAIDPMTGPSRMRALHKLHGVTQVRRAKDGGREFLLHRGMGPGEYRKKVEGKDTINHTIRSSWTPNRGVASNIISGGAGGRVASAWIHEKHIVHVPKQLGELENNRGRFTAFGVKSGFVPKGPNRFSPEHEVIVESGHNSKAHVSEIKKGAMQRLAPFNPKNIDPANVYESQKWQEADDEADRGQIPRMAGNMRIRALHKLHGTTSVRRAKDGGREFLLHRGMSDEEYLTHAKQGNQYKTGYYSSWTPHREVASIMATRHEDEKDTPHRVISAWIHEKDIHHIPKQAGWHTIGAWSKEGKTPGENVFAEEHEIIVQPKSKLKLQKSILEKSKGLLLFPGLGVKQKHYTIGYKKPEYIQQAIKRYDKKIPSKYIQGIGERTRGTMIGRVKTGAPLEYQHRSVIGGVVPKEHHSTISHEEQHGIFQSVAENHGKKLMSKIAGHLMRSLPPKHRAYVKMVIGRDMSGYPMVQRDEETIARMHNYLNDENWRGDAHIRAGIMSSKEQMNAHTFIKQAFEHMRNTAKNLKPEDISDGYISAMNTPTYMSKTVLRKEVFPGGQSEAHGWISPEGKFHKLDPHVNHGAWIRHNHKIDTYDAYHKGWLAIGKAGFYNITGHDEHLMNPHHPATLKARQLAGDHFGEITQLSTQTRDINAPTHRWSKHGTIPEGPETGYYRDMTKSDDNYAIRPDPHVYSGTRAIYAYHKGRKIGHVFYADDPDSKGWHNVRNANVEMEHRRKGVYTKLLHAAKIDVQSRGSKGLKSQGYQRSSFSNKVWEKIHTDKIEHKPVYPEYPDVDYFLKNTDLILRKDTLGPAGWISPKGEYTPITRSESHFSHIKYKHGFMTENRARNAGWISIGHGNERNIAGNSEWLADSSHPATQTAKKMVREHFGGDSLEIYHSDTNKIHIVDADHWAKHGTIPKPGSVADFRKTVDLKKMALVFDHERDKKPHTTVWRMENEKGQGPYHHGDMSFMDYMKTPSAYRRQPVPHEDRGFSRHEVESPSPMGPNDTRYRPAPYEGKKFGFASKEQAEKWFTPEETHQLKQRGFELKPKKAKRVWAGTHQVYYEPHEDEIKKEMWNASPQERKSASKYHGWISPSGKFHSMGANMSHREWAENKLRASRVAINQEPDAMLVNQGWLRSGLSGTKSVYGHSRVLHDPTHPATRKFASLISDVSPDEPVAIFTENAMYSVPHHRAKNGVFTQPSIVAEFHKNDAYDQITKPKVPSIFSEHINPGEATYQAPKKHYAQRNYTEDTMIDVIDTKNADKIKQKEDEHRRKMEGRGFLVGGEKIHDHRGVKYSLRPHKKGVTVDWKNLATNAFSDRVFRNEEAAHHNIKRLVEEFELFKKCQHDPKAEFHKNDPINNVYSFEDVQIMIEWPKGSVRKYTDGYEKEMKCDYGYILGTKGDDGEEEDVYVGDNKASKRIFLIEQNDSQGGEDKIMFGFNSPEEAKLMYLAHMELKNFKSIREITLDNVRQMIDRSKGLRLGHGDHRGEEGKIYIVNQGMEKSILNKLQTLKKCIFDPIEFNKLNKK